MRMIFHHPLPLNYNATTASGIRPIKMLETFKNIGYEVDLAVGYSNERTKSIAKIKENIKNGIIYDFCYSESSTMPTLLCDTHHLPLHPFLDFGFFEFLKKNNIPIGLFYRDIYWRFPIYKESVSAFKAAVAGLFYRYDLKMYAKLLTKLYLPTELMADYIPFIRGSLIEALPPGAEPGFDSSIIANKNSKLNLIYVGGLNNHYKLHKLFEAVQNNNKVTLTLCTRLKDWQDHKYEYEKYINSNVFIQHKSGKELKDLYENSDVACICVEPQEYWNFAAPVKLFEYLGNYKPVIASNSTYAGSFVEKNRIGWNISYDKKSLEQLIDYLSEHPEEIRKISDNCRKIAQKHTWLARAEQVKMGLMKK